MLQVNLPMLALHKQGMIKESLEAHIPHTQILLEILLLIIINTQLGWCKWTEMQYYYKLAIHIVIGLSL